MGQPRKKALPNVEGSYEQINAQQDVVNATSVASDLSIHVPAADESAKTNAKTDSMKEGKPKSKTTQNQKPTKPESQTGEVMDRFSIKAFAGLDAERAKTVFNKYARGQRISDPVARTLAYYGYLTRYTGNNTFEASENLLKTVTTYFETQLKSVDTVSPMTEICPGADGPKKTVRYYHVVWDLCDVIRAYPERYLKPLTDAVHTVMSLVIANDTDEKASKILDQEEQKLTSNSRARARLSETAAKFKTVMAKKSPLSWDEFIDFASRMRLFAPGFSPKSWKESVK